MEDAAGSVSRDAEALSRALVEIGAPAEPVAAVEWMFAYPGAHSLLHRLISSFNPSCVLSEKEIVARSTLPPPDAHVFSRALPVVRGVHRPPVSRTEAIRTRLKLLRAQRDALAPIVRAHEEAAEEAFAATLRGGDNSDSAASSVRTTITKARMARIRLASLLPLPPTTSASRSARSVLITERHALCSLLGTAKTLRDTGREASEKDRLGAEDALLKFAPLFGAAAARRARREGRSEEECEKERIAARKEAADIVTMEIAERTRQRQRTAIRATANAVENTSVQCVRLEILLRALRIKREVHTMLNDFLRAAAAAKPPDTAALVNETRQKDSETCERIDEILGTAEKQLDDLWGNEVLTESVSLASELQAKIDELSGPVKNLLVEITAHAELTSTETTATAIKGVHDAVAKIGIALDTLLRERKSRLTTSTPSSSSDTGATGTVDGAEYEAIIEYHVGRRKGKETESFSSMPALGTGSSRSVISNLSERSAASSATEYGRR